VRWTPLGPASNVDTGGCRVARSLGCGGIRPIGHFGQIRQIKQSTNQAIWREIGGIVNTMSDRQDILNRVKKVTVEELGVKEEEVSETASFQEDLGADSLDVVELVMALEDEFGIDIPDEEVGEIKTVGDAVSYIEKKQTSG